MSRKSEENSVLMTAESEELDYEEDDAKSPVKKPALALEKEKDLEDGEILDTNDEDCPKKRICYFFQRGECRLGDKCTGLHVTDCLYKMIDSPPDVSPEFQNGYHGPNPQPNNSNLLCSMINPSTTFSASFQNSCSTANIPANTSNLVNYELILTDWDRALIEAKKLVKKFDKTTNRSCPPVTVTIESDDERLSDKSTNKPRRYRSPSPKMLSRDSSLSDNVKKLPKQKLVDSKRDWHRANKWHDPWRRSPVHHKESFHISRSPQRRKPDLSISEKRHAAKIAGNRNKGISRRSLSRPSISPVHRLRKENSKPFQKENVSPRIDVTKIKSSISKQEPPEIPAKRHKPDSHRSSSSSSRASIHRSIKENLKLIQEKKTVKNKPIRNLKLSISDQRPREIAENWHRTVFRRSSSPSSIHRSIKDNLKTVEKTMGNKRDKNVKNSNGQPHKIAENGHKTTCRRSPTSSSPPSVHRSREKWPKGKTKPQTSKEVKKISLAVRDRNSKSNEHLKEKFHSSNSTSECRLNDVGKWTPKKVRLPIEKSCSDMSISPLTDSSLSDIFNPDKNENEDMKQHETSRSRSFQSQKKCQAEVYGPIFPPEYQIIAPSMSETKSEVIQNNKFAIQNSPATTKVVSNLPVYTTTSKAVHVSKSKQVKNRKFCRNLEADLFKFHRETILPDDAQQESTGQPESLHEQKSTETEVKMRSKKNVSSQKMPETQNNRIKRETSLTKNKTLSRKEAILKQLEAINAAIERKKTSMYVLRK